MAKPLHNLALSLALALGVVLACSDDDTVQPGTFQGQLCSETSAGKQFDDRIAPLLRDDRPSSCNECHLSGIDLSLFVSGNPCDTMACMVDQGLVDLKAPEDSLILSWIERANPASPLITQDVIDEEYGGVLDWIRYNAACGQEVCAGAVCSHTQDAFCGAALEPKLEDLAGKNDYPTGCTDLDLEQLFLDSVYRSRGRCSPCHFDNWEKNTIGSPPWIHTAGDCNSASLATLREIERRGYIDIDDPDHSLLILKPLAVSEGGLEHGGDDKFHGGANDTALINFTHFVEHYAACKRGEAPPVYVPPQLETDAGDGG